jgi:hypothetical protein
MAAWKIVSIAGTITLLLSLLFLGFVFILLAASVGCACGG